MASPAQFSLADRRALITGASQGIGLGLARGLAEAGARVILNGRNQAKVASAVDSLRALGHHAEGAVFDITDATAVDAAIAQLLAGGQSIDILVNNAGIQIRAPLLETEPATWRKVIDTNLTGAFQVARAVAPGMIARQSGKIVNVSSIAGDLARATTGPYTASKAALSMLTRTMCVEWAGKNLQINGLAPGFILTEMTESLRQDAQFDSLVRSRTPAGRWGQVDDLIGACVFLCSPAANFVNGHVLVVDGGRSVVL